jgi:hypothetical protein
MDTVTSTEQHYSEPPTVSKPSSGSDHERGGADAAGSPSAEAGVVTPRLAHHSYSDGIVLPGFCWRCGKALFEHVP